MAINTYFKNIADAIREKTGSSAFITPGQMPQAIRDIMSGGVELIPPTYENVTQGWYVTNGGELFGYIGTQSVNDVYLIEKTGNYVFFTGSSNYGNRMRIAQFADNPLNYNPTSTTQEKLLSGVFFYNYHNDVILPWTITFNSSSNLNNIHPIDSSAIGNYIVVTKNNTGVLTDKVYLFRIDDFLEA